MQESGSAGADVVVEQDGSSQAEAKEFATLCGSGSDSEVALLCCVRKTFLAVTSHCADEISLKK